MRPILGLDLLSSYPVKEATLAQKASSLDKIKILSLEAKISELEGKLENLELEQVFHDSNINGGILEELKNKVKEIEKKIAKEDLLEVLQKALSEKNFLIQEAKLKEPTNACLAEQIQKTSSEYEVHGGTKLCLSASDQNEPSSVSKLEKDNDITNPELIRPQRDLSILPITAGHKVTQALKNQKTGLPPMKLCLLDMDEVTKHESSQNIGHPAMTWPFSMLVTGRSGSDKTNLLANLVLGDKDEYMQRGKKADF
ncbi:hypothetical protein GLOIN_2v1790954 [Rhizophagus clarus]|uniref:Uncharacterized protein n=1 Tax=Rhizophagus clarus TaxID=94130 RepID=A0A8H3LLL5_9GLOM|nr:hypothetical protein GLOIN_2v1790954 [Rhizophagus clarus]